MMVFLHLNNVNQEALRNSCFDREIQKKNILGAETSRAEPEKGRNLSGPNQKRAETSGNLGIY